VHYGAKLALPVILYQTEKNFGSKRSSLFRRRVREEGKTFGKVNTKANATNILDL
jgi:hypothetical protein